MKLRCRLSRVLLGFGGVVGVFLSDFLPAHFNESVSRYRVTIDGVNYGAFEGVAGLTPVFDQTMVPGTSFRKVTLHRDFVTEPSLYLWARGSTSRQADSQDVLIVGENHAGEEVTRYLLRLCQPLAWTVEAASPEMGGYHETVDLAVKEIAHL